MLKSNNCLAVTKAMGVFKRKNYEKVKCRYLLTLTLREKDRARGGAVRKTLGY